MDQEEFSYTLKIPKERVGVLIGKSGEIAKVLDIASRTVTKRLSNLKGKELVESPKMGLNRLTEKGRKELEEMLLAVPIDFGELGSMLEELPSEVLVSFYRLMISAIIAKKHLFKTFERGWPGFIIGGPTRTGKTLLAYVVEKMLGVTGTVKHVQVATMGCPLV